MNRSMIRIIGLSLIVKVVGAALSKVGCRLETMDDIWQVREFIGGIHGSIDWQRGIDGIFVAVGDQSIAESVWKELRYYEGVDVVDDTRIHDEKVAWFDIKSIDHGLNRCNIRLVDGWDSLQDEKAMKAVIHQNQNNTFDVGGRSKTKIALLVPTKSTDQDNSFLKFLYPSLLESLPQDDPKYHYTIYLGHDEDDPIIQNANFRAHPNVSIVMQQMPPVKMITLYWNLLFKTAYMDGNDYFYQLNDDVIIASHRWTDAFVTKLQSMDYFGVVAPSDAMWKCHLFTQSFVSRKHYEMFGWYFPPEIKDWYSDNWITEVYGHLAHCLPDHGIINGNTKQRYTACKSPPWRESLARDQEKVSSYHHATTSKDSL